MGLHKRAIVEDETLQIGRFADTDATILNAILHNILLKVVCFLPGCLMKLVEKNGAYIEI